MCMVDENRYTGVSVVATHPLSRANGWILVTEVVVARNLWPAPAQHRSNTNVVRIQETDTIYVLTLQLVLVAAGQVEAP